MIAPQDERTVIPAHTPKRLEDQALENFVHMVVQHSVPASLHCDLLPQVSEVRWSDDPNKLDRIIMTSESTWPELLPQKHLFMEHLKKLKHWWDDNEWLGKQNSQIRRQIKECFTMELELVDPHCKYPLFKFLLHLMFSTKALGASDTAEFPHYPKVQLELRRNGCPVYADVLRSLKPFVIEELSTQYIIFGDTEPWIVIIENSPFLKKVHLRKNICEEILLCIGQNCPQLDTFILEQVFGSLMVPIDCLYKTFFSGLDYESVNTLTSGIPSNMQKYLSFPRLKLPHLTSLSVACSAWLDSNIVNSLVEKLISASPVLTNLELMLAHGPCEWLMGMAVDKMLNGIRTLRLSFGTHCVNDWGDDFSVEVGASFYVPLIELLPDLEVLMLGIHHIDVLTQLKLTYRTSQFKIVVRRKPYIGYDVLNPM
ncbi:hypothetical protein Hamer_G022191 [Homarus americanus]|uniref:Uncharacterized protein n=1 Tax=Homarus americanus TaxID=6706 RepID=A0A8J5MTL4_HOMAM|nr:hypothetical protein Hamer_G022191 [Homarus americanus]